MVEKTFTRKEALQMINLISWTKSQSDSELLNRDFIRLSFFKT